MITCVKWGKGLLYTGSKDKVFKVWRVPERWHMLVYNSEVVQHEEDSNDSNDEDYLTGWTKY